MKKLDHPNVVRLMEVIDDEEGDKLYMGKLLIFSRFHDWSLFAIVMDYATFGEVMKWDSKLCVFSPYDPKVEHLTEKEIKQIMRGCIRGLNYRSPLPNLIW
jgi:serine/threonine protein kinase